jgi:hypothetical protein
MTTATKPERRKPTFATLDDVVRDAERLLAKGYERAGNWDLAQVCLHLAEWLRFPVEGFPKVPLLLRPPLWVVRTALGAKLKAKVLANGFDAGTRTMPQTVFAAGEDATAAVSKLKAAADQLKAHAGPIHPSPLFGPMTKDEAVRLQLKHCEHHLSFLVPHG